MRKAPIVPLTNAQRARVVEALGLVRHVASRYRHRKHRDFPDLLQEGTIAVSHAVRLYNPALGCSFGVYAYTAIRNAMVKWLGANRSVVPRAINAAHPPRDASLDAPRYLDDGGKVVTRLDLVADEGPSVEAQVVEQEERRKIREVLSRDSEGELAYASVLAGATEIASVLGVSRQTVTARRTLAMARIEKALRRELDAA